jgi:hypothetical protein
LSTSTAIPEARRRSRSPVPTSAPGFCKREVRECYRVSVSRSADAAEAWRNAKRKHPETDPGEIPRGVPVFWLGGSDGHGHVSIATGKGGHWTTDLIRPGWFDRTGIARVSRTWSSLRLVGWTEDLDGVVVWRDGEAVAPRMFTLGAADVDAQLNVIHEVDDREEAFASASAAVHDDLVADAMVVAARRWIGADL